MLEPAAHHVEAGADRDRRAFFDLGGKALRGAERFAFGDQLGDETDLEPFGRRDMPSRQDHAHRLFLWNGARQSVQTSRQGSEPDPRLRQGEARVLRCDDHVAGERQLKPAAHRDTVDRGDHRLGAVEAFGDAAEAALRLVASAAFSLKLKVVAGAKGAVAGPRQDANPEIRVGFEVVEDLV